MPLPLLTHLWLAVASPAPAELAPDVDEVELSWALAQELRAAAADDPSATAPGPWVAEREIELQAVEGGLVLMGRWTIVAEQAGWLAGELLGPGIELRSATLDGKPAPVVALPGTTMLVAWIDARQRVELRVRAFVPAELDDRLALGLLPATRGRLRTAIPGRVAVPVTDDEDGGDEGTGHAGPARLEGDVVWSGAPRLVVQLRDPSGATPPARDALAVAHVGVGLTVGDAEVRGRAHLQWALRQGTLSRVRATVAGVGDDLMVEGPSVATWSRSGDAIDVELTAPASGRVDLELRWTQAIGAGDETRLPLPRIEPDAWRSESSLQLARDGELEVIPAVEEGTAIAAAELPEWGQGLVEGTPTAAYQRGGSSPAGALELLRFVPVPGPPTVIDVADYTVATTEEGRVLMKVRYDLRNDRAAHLSVRPPPGLRIIGARVGLDTALPGKGDDGAWRIPLRRSLETVDGLLSFPVEVILLGEQEPWERRERRELLLPTLDAPIAAARVTLSLPARYRSRLEPGERNVVDGFDEGEGLAYGKGVSSDEAAVADALLEEAVQGYLQNDFEGAQAKLEQIEALGVDNANVARLRSNIDVIEGKAEAADKGDVTMQRRVKEQAKARASEDFRRQETLIAEAEKAAQAGDYAEAEAQYQAALDLGGKLAKLEQSESVEQDTRNVSVEAQLSHVSKKKRKKGKRDAQTLDTKFAENIRFGSIATPVSGGEAASSGKGRESLDGGSRGPSEGIDAILDPAAVVVSKTTAEPPPPPSAEEPPQVQRVMPEGQSPAQDPLEGRLDVPLDAPLAGPIAEPAPVPEPELDDGRDREIDEDADVYADVLDGEPVVRRKLHRRSRGRASGIEYKRAPPRSRIAARRRAPAGTKQTSAVTVYDFEDDTIDGELLSPEGANVASRARTKAASPMAETPASLTTVDELAPDDGAPMLASREQPHLTALAPPEVTASALSVIVPVTGQVVLYQQLLIEANQTQVIEIDARRRLRR